MFWIGVLIVVVILIIYISTIYIPTKQYVVEGMVVNVLSDSKNKDQAITIMIECNKRMLKLLTHLRKKFKIGITDEECSDECKKWITNNYRERQCIDHLLRNFNYESIHENLSSAKNVAYSLDKGKTIMLCLRDATNTGIVDINTLMFVIIHEAAHIANYDEWGHGPKFWEIFKYLLQESVAIGIYKTVDYSKHPTRYCGFLLNHNPLTDPRIAIITIS
jgi:hypothetical protein